MNYERTLQVVLNLSCGVLRREGVRWALVGSAATALQGVEIVPGDLDLLTMTPRGVYTFARLMSFHNASRSPAPVGTEDWLSTPGLPVSADEPDPQKTVWHFGRWLVEGFKVEVAHIEPPADFFDRYEPRMGIWEGGPQVWPHIKLVQYRGCDVPVVPLEIQLQTSMSRGLMGRAEAIAGVLHRRGYDADLLAVSLSAEHRAKLAETMPELKEE